MNIAHAYQTARDMTDTITGQAIASAFRNLFRTEFVRQQHEDEALAALRAFGDDGTHLRQAVALAAVGATDEDLERAMRHLMTGQPTPEEEA